MLFFAISEYGKKLDMVMPVVDENCQEIELLKARHPLIDQKEVVANDIVLKKPQDIYSLVEVTQEVRQLL